MGVTLDAIDCYVAELRDLQHRGGDADEELVAEVIDHLRSLQEELIAAGCDGDEAARSAVQRFGAPQIAAAGSAGLLPRSFDVGLVVTVVLVCFGPVGVVAATVQSVVHAGQGAAGRGLSVAMIFAGFAGLVIGEGFWLRRGDRALRSDRRLVIVVVAVLAIVAGIASGLAVATAVASGVAGASRFLALGIALSLGAITYPRLRARFTR